MGRPTSKQALEGHRVTVEYESAAVAGSKDELVLLSPAPQRAPLARCSEVWLEDAVFVASGSTRFVAGTVIADRPQRVVTKFGWAEVRLDTVEEGCFYCAGSGGCIQSAKYTRLRRHKMEAFGIRKGAPLVSLPELRPNPGPRLPVLGPRRDAWRGEMGGINYEAATFEATVEAIRWALAQHPGAVIVDGTDDWNAPDYVRPQLLIERWGIAPLAWWHTGLSGESYSGAVLSVEAYERMASSYRRDFACELEAVPGLRVPRLVRGPCGCWGGEALRVYR